MGKNEKEQGDKGLTKKITVKLFDLKKFRYQNFTKEAGNGKGLAKLAGNTQPMKKEDLKANIKEVSKAEPSSWCCNKKQVKEKDSKKDEDSTKKEEKKGKEEHGKKDLAPESGCVII